MLAVILLVSKAHEVADKMAHNAASHLRLIVNTKDGAAQWQAIKAWALDLGIRFFPANEHTAYERWYAFARALLARFRGLRGQSQKSALQEFIPTLVPTLVLYLTSTQPLYQRWYQHW